MPPLCTGHSGEKQSSQREPMLIPLTSVILVLITLSVCGYAAAQDNGGGVDNEMPRYWEIHAGLMSAGTMIIVLGYLSLWLKWLGKLESLGVPVPMGKRVARFWYKWHVALGTAGLALTLGGIAWAYLIVQWAYGGPHLRLGHSWIGLATGVTITTPVLLGYLTRHIRKGKRTLRWWHVGLGFSGMAMMFIGLSTGFGLD